MRDGEQSWGLPCVRGRSLLPNPLCTGSSCTRWGFTLTCLLPTQRPLPVPVVLLVYKSHLSPHFPSAAVGFGAVKHLENEVSPWLQAWGEFWAHPEGAAAQLNRRDLGGIEG